MPSPSRNSSRRLPEHYTRLLPFLECFATGVPVLMYHKLGPRPRKVRLKGLYLSRSLFAQQLAELRNHGFRSADLSAVTGGEGNPGKHVGITFDDGFESVLCLGLEPLAASGLRATQFLVAGRLGQTNTWEQTLGEAPEKLMDAAQVRDWLAAGHQIGSHTLSHPFLTQLPRDEAKEQIQASKRKLEDVFGVPIRHFCYPYGDWDETVRDLVKEAGYQTACTTEFGVNTRHTDPFAIKRITARYQTLKWRTLASWLRQRFELQLTPACATLSFGFGFRGVA